MNELFDKYFPLVQFFLWILHRELWPMIFKPQPKCPPYNQPSLNFLAMITTPSKVEALRKLLYSAMHQAKYLMDKQIVPGNLKKYLAIEELTQRFDTLKNKTIEIHYTWLVKMRNQVIDILPPAQGKYDKQRMKLVQLLNEAENKVNHDARVRVAIH